METFQIIVLAIIAFILHCIILVFIIKFGINELTKYARMNANFTALLCKKMGVTAEEMKKVTDEVDPDKKDWLYEYIY